MVVFGWWGVNFSPVAKNPPVKSQIFAVKKGAALSAVAQGLADDGLIRNALFFKLYIKFRGLTKKIQTGRYQLNSSLNVAQITAILIKPPADLRLTFPEGWRKEEIAQRLSVNLDDFNKQEFLKLAKNLEGKLFPDTYLIPLEASTSAIIEIFSKNFAGKTKALNLKDEGLVLASIIEREVKGSQDRRIVAGILRKRLGQGWPLQTDATLQYAAANSKFEIRNSKLESWWAPLTKEDLKINSPYNTYENQGLPPTPICNPGLDSMQAILEPVETAYWFYLSDNQGQIHYAKTLEEHLQNIANYLSTE
jgi:UPF0755 protein